MRKHKLLILLLALSMLAVYLPLFPMQADAKTEKYYVTDYGAKGSDTKDDYYGIQAALDKAKGNSNPIEVIVPAGTYYIQYNLAIYSNTTLTLQSGATIVSNVPDNPMLYGAHVGSDGQICRYKESGCKHGGYTQVVNVTIQGGTWDCNASNNKGFDGLCVRHGANITIQNTTIKNCSNHSLNLSGVNGAVVYNVTFKDAVAYAGASLEDLKTKEAIHLDYCNKSNENSDRSYPYDDSASKNVTISNCTFQNVYAGAGTHHSENNYRGGPITVTNNVAKNVTSYFVYGCNYDSLTISNNTLTNTGALCTLTNCSATITGNTVSCSGKEEIHGIYIQGGTKATITQNTITNATLSGIGIVGGSTVTANSNKITLAKSHGLKVEENSKLSAEFNDLSELGGCGFYVNKASLSASNNSIVNVDNHAVYAKDHSVVDFSNNRINGTGKKAIADDGNGNTVKETGNTQAGAGWTKSSDGSEHYYYDADGSKHTGWLKYEGRWYYMNTYGVMQTGWQKISKKWYYFKDTGSMLTGWQKIDNKQYYLGTDGALKTGWQKVNDKWYYIGSDGVMVTGWVKSGGKYYYMRETGSMVTNWQQIGKKWYYFDENGIMLTGWQKLNNKWFYLGSDGAMRTGWQDINDTRYYFNNEGAMKSGWQQIDNQYYYLGTDGAMRTGWQKINNKWFYLGTDGAMRTGWQKIKGSWYYFNNEGAMKSGWQQIGKYYYYLGTDGVLQTGWQKINNKWFYFNESGAMQTGTVTINGKKYTFSETGALIQ